MKKLSLIIITAVVGMSLKAQVPASPTLPNVVPPSPDAQSLGKFGAIPVGLFTGIPQISVPIYELKVGSFTLPISLSYHASGVKVEEVASSVGLGWALDAGGTMSRAVYGQDDYLTTGFITTNYQQPTSVPQSTIQFDYGSPGGYYGGYEYYYAKKIANAEGDAQPDLFFYNFCGMSGKFYIDQDRQVHPIPFTSLKFDFEPGLPTVNITDQQGNKYYFYWGEGSMTEDACGISTNGSQYLSKIVMRNQDSIVFDYDTVQYTYKMHGSIAQILLKPGQTSMGIHLVHADCFGTGADAEVTVYGIRLKSITSSRGTTVEFTYTNSRSDINSGLTKSLNAIQVKYNGTVIKNCDLYQSYFTPATGLSGTPEDNRLRLDSVKMDDQVYKFNYNAQQLPGRLSYAQDHWGFYNGKTSNTTLLVPDYEKGYLSGSDRAIDTSYTKAGIMTKMTYPTGGYTLFDYEPNDYHYTGTEKTFAPRSHNLQGTAISTVTDTFTVPSIPKQILNGRVYMRSDPLYGDTYLGTPAIDPPCVIELSSDSGFYQSWQNLNAQAGFPVTLTPGHYTMSVRTDSNYSNTFMRVQFEEMLTQNVNKNVLLGGLRIRKTSDYADSLDNTPIVKMYKYTDPDSSQFSSGEVNFLPTYTHSITYTMEHPQMSTVPGVMDIVDMLWSYHDYYKQLGQPVFSLGSIHGGSVGYTNVETWEGAGAENGKTVSKFSFTGDYGGTESAPMVPSISQDWESGYLREEAKYKNNGAGFTLLQKQNNYYSSRSESEFWDAHYDSTRKDDYYRGWGINIGYKHTEFQYGLYFKPAEFLWNDYHFISKWVRLDSTEVQVADQHNPSNFLGTKTRFTYENPYNLLATITQAINSKGDTLRNIKRYPHDSVSSLATEAGLAKTALKTNWQTGTVLEEESKKNSTIIYTQRTNYKRYGDMVLPDNVQTSTYNNSLDTRINFNKYDSKGNLIEDQKASDLKKSYIWDYNLNYPVAECTNADSASIAQTSFEAEGKGNWTFSGSVSNHPTAPTGQKAYNLNGGNITRSGLSSGTTYIVTYWKRDSAGSVTVNSSTGTSMITKNGWILYSHEITGTTSLTISGGTYVDELRLYPKAAMMTSYTYTPLVGVTTQCDINNRIIYYEYDNYNRLKLIRDQDRNILKRIDYKYQAAN